MLADHIGCFCQVDGVRFQVFFGCGVQQIGKVRQLLAGDQLIEIVFHIIRIEEVPDAHTAVVSQVPRDLPVGGMFIIIPCAVGS